MILSYSRSCLLLSIGLCAEYAEVLGEKMEEATDASDRPAILEERERLCLFPSTPLQQEQEPMLRKALTEEVDDMFSGDEEAMETSDGDLATGEDDCSLLTAAGSVDEALACCWCCVIELTLFLLPEELLVDLAGESSFLDRFERASQRC